MSDKIQIEGACLCGQVKIKASTEPEVAACHCRMCRRWGGGPALEVDGGSEPVFEGSEHIGHFKSSEWAERGFCKNCGSHLFYRLLESNQHFIPVGLFDVDDDALRFTMQVFIDEKPGYYHFREDTGTMTGAEVQAAFNPDG